MNDEVQDVMGEIQGIRNGMDAVRRLDEKDNWPSAARYQLQQMKDQLIKLQNKIEDLGLQDNNEIRADIEELDGDLFELGLRM